MRPSAFFLCIIAACLSGCHRTPLLPGIPRSEREPVTRHGMPADSSSTPVLPGEKGSHLYLTAVRFAEGYAWQTDTCREDGRAVIELYRDGQLILSVPARESQDPDRHRFCGGHLYQDTTEDGETLLLRDGEEYLRFEGREALRGFLEVDGHLHTLGQDRDGRGVSYRIDGEAVFRDPAGIVLGDADAVTWEGGALTWDGQNVWFAYSIPLSKDMEGLREYHIMKGIQRAGTIPAGEFREIFDIRVLQGEPCWVGIRAGNNPRLCLVKNGETFPLPVASSATPARCRLFRHGGDILVKGRFDGPGGSRYSILSPDGVVREFGLYQRIAEIFPDGEDLAWIQVRTDGFVLSCGRDDRPLSLSQQNLKLSSARCAILRDSCFRAALTGWNGSANLLVTDGETEEFPFNGYFTGLYVE